MTELAKGLPESDKTAIAHATDLLTHYSFDLGHQTVSQLVQQWLKDFSAGWVRWAVIEALYQGRYKAVSVDQILRLWQRRNNPCYHFNYEFERLVCNKFPKNLNSKDPELPPVKSLASWSEAVPSLDATTSTSVATVQEAAPAWFALAEQIQSAPLEASPLKGSEGAIEPFPKVITSSLPKVEALLALSGGDLKASDDWSQSEAAQDSSQSAPDEVLEDHQPPIHQFTPTHPGSDFYAKLKAVAEQNGENG